MPVYKQALLYSQPERLIGKRKSVWKCILKMNSNTRDYNAFKAKVKEDPSLIKNVEEVIVLDVQRSVHNMSGVDQTELTDILKTYAFFN
jgi:predicted RNA-binding protein with PUA domain